MIFNNLVIEQKKLMQIQGESGTVFDVVQRDLAGYIFVISIETNIQIDSRLKQIYHAYGYHYLHLTFAGNY